MVTLKFYPVGAHYEIGGPLFSPQLLLTILQCGLLIRKQRETTLVLKCVTRSFVSILYKIIFQMMNNMGGMGMDGPDVGVSTCIIFLMFIK